jgi:zinc protease
MPDGSPSPAGQFNGNGDTRLVMLDNGLAIIVREDPSAPVVSAQAWAKTGSIHEGDWLGAGLSHILEHMLFKGTESRGVGRIEQEVQEAGGYMNAYTSFDRTVFHIDVPNTGARVAVDILCDIMQHATLPEAEMEKELDVIRREIDMGQDDPGCRASRRLFETAYTTSPYRHTVIGYPDIFNELSRDDIVGYYRARYIPGNIFYVIVGDVDTDEVVEQVATAFAKNKSKPLPPVMLPAEPRQTSPREVVEEAAVQLGHLHYSWHVPDVRHPDLPALDVLATLLGCGRSSRLYQNVRERKGLINSGSAWTYTPSESGLFGISAVVNADKFGEARVALLDELDQLKSGQVEPAELNKVVKQFVSATLGTRKTMEGQAQDLGDCWISVNDLDFSDRYLAAVKKVTPEDFRRVAKEYLHDDNRTLYALLPTGASPVVSRTRVRHASSPIQRFEFPNGLRLLVKEDHRLPFVQMRAVFQGGVLAEKMGNGGITQLMAKLLVKGTASRTGQQIAEQIESVGGGIDAYGGNNSFGVSLEVLNGDIPLGLEMMADVILHPSFPESAFERQRVVQHAALKAQQDKVLMATFRLMRENLFGEQGYGLDTLGTESSLDTLSADDLSHFHQRLTVPNNAVLAIFGDVKTEEIRAAAETAFGLWPAGNGFRAPNLLPPGEGMRRVVNQREKEQAVAVLGYRGCDFFAEDRYALELLCEACSDMGSRLFLRIREELGLAYYVGANSQPGFTPGYIAFYAGTSPGQLEQVEKELLGEVAKLRQDGLSTEELHRAKAKIIGQKKIARQDLGGLAIATGLDELYGLGYEASDEEDEKFEAVTPRQIQQAAQKYLRPGHCVMAVTHP